MVSGRSLARIPRVLSTSISMKFSSIVGTSLVRTIPMARDDAFCTGLNAKLRSLLLVEKSREPLNCHLNKSSLSAAPSSSIYLQLIILNLASFSCNRQMNSPLCTLIIFHSFHWHVYLGLSNRDETIITSKPLVNFRAHLANRTLPQVQVIYLFCHRHL